MRALYTSATGMVAQQFSLDVIANNLANVNTNGFKRSTAHFRDLMYQTLAAPGAPNSTGGQLPTGSQVGLGVDRGTTHQIYSQGTFQTTGGDYDVAIQGSGFIKVELPDGNFAYSRDGALTIDSTGRLVTSDGYVVKPEVLIPGDKLTVTVSPDGVVSVTRPGQANSEEAGRIKLTRFTNPYGMEQLGNNLFRKTDAAGEETEDTPGQNGLGNLMHKALESGNVEVVEELIRMITIQRAYETNSKAIQTADEMLQGANNLKR